MRPSIFTFREAIAVTSSISENGDVHYIRPNKLGCNGTKLYCPIADQAADNDKNLNQLPRSPHKLSNI
jgi:hypothetical protein